MLSCTVFYESWQMECCGAAFSEGDSVKWLVCRGKTLILPNGFVPVDYFYEEHSSEWESLFVLTGKVTSIGILYKPYAMTADFEEIPIPEGRKIVRSERAQGFEKGPEGQDADGYIVRLIGCTIRPARQEEVTFC